MPHWTFKEPAAIRNSKNLDPDRIAEVIRELPNDDRPTRLWRAARDPKHYLHDCYEWDVQLAAEAHWRSTSAKIMRSIVSVSDEGVETPAFISIAVENDFKRYYEPQEIISNRSLQIALLHQARRELRAARKRYAQLTGLCAAAAGLDSLIEGELGRMEQSEQSPSGE